MRVPLKIYLSSTFLDLEQHREKVYHALRGTRADVIAMEDYVATDTRPVEKCLADVRDADIYVGIFAWRYGFVPPKRNPKQWSVTEFELREAQRRKKPRLIFLLKPTAPWPPSMMDTTTGDNERGDRINTLRHSLQEEMVVGLFESADELATKVLGAVQVWQMDASTASVGSPAEPPHTRRASAIGRNGYDALWENGSNLRVRFLDGDPALQGRVLRTIQLWSAYANVSFQLSEAEDAEVRVSFTQPGSWSYEGPLSLAVPNEQPTANFGWLDVNSDTTELEAVVLHEFGHVLGLAHEQANPDAPIKWDKKRAYQDLGGPPNYWNRSAVDNHLFTTWDRNRFPLAKPFDPLSIMTLPVSKEWTRNGFSIARNVAISVGDKEFTGRLYPYS